MTTQRLPNTLLYLAVVLMLASMGCAPMTYNRYQTAHTLGKGEMKVMLSANLAHDALYQTYPDMDNDMDDAMREWARENDIPYDIFDFTEDIFSTLAIYSLYGSTAGLVPEMELAYAVGVHDRLDLEVRVSASLYGRLNTKIQLAELGEYGALSISPGFGYRQINQDSGTTEMGKIDVEDSYEGWAMSGELPLLVGWKFKHVSPYFAPLYVYHYAKVDYTRKSVDYDPEFKKTLEYDLDFHQIGLVAGVQFNFWHILITPEVVGMYHTGDGMDMWMVYPGLAIGGYW